MHIAGAEIVPHWSVQSGRGRRGRRWYIGFGIAVILGWGWAVDSSGQTMAPGENTLAMEPVVVTVTVAPTPLGRTTAPVTVISREQIEAQQVESVTELLRPGTGGAY